MMIQVILSDESFMKPKQMTLRHLCKICKFMDTFNNCISYVDDLFSWNKQKKEKD